MTGLELYQYEPRRDPLITPWDARRLLQVTGRMRTAIAWGKQRVEAWRREGAVYLELEGRTYRVEMGELARAAEDSDRVYVIARDGLRPVEARGRGYYKLVPVHPRAPPTLEISGIHMHRVSGTDPLRDTRAKLRAARIRRGVDVLDTTMGLGYTAVGSLLAGARRVVTVEVDENVILMASYNPWSWRLGDPRITLIHGDAVRVVSMLEDESFDRVIHDPPRLSGRTGDLYGEEFYRELYRVLRPGGVLFHYTGEPGRLRRLNVPGRVAGRLRRVGFLVEGYDREAMGVVAVRGR